jgi:hypothetical protein
VLHTLPAVAAADVDAAAAAATARGIGSGGKCKASARKKKKKKRRRVVGAEQTAALMPPAAMLERARGASRSAKWWASTRASTRSCI